MKKRLALLAGMIVATPVVSKCNDGKELRPITTRSGRQNDVKILAENELRRRGVFKIADGHNFTKYNQPGTHADPRPEAATSVRRMTWGLQRKRIGSRPESPRLTTMMVTHSMAHAASLGDRLVMVHQGRLIFDASGAAKQRLRPHDLLEKFEELRRSDQLDETAAELLREVYV